MKKIKFWLDGCDIAFVAEAPEDITLKQLLKQCDKITPNYCTCGIKSISELEEEGLSTDIIIEYNNIKKTSEDVPCLIGEE